MAWLMLDLVGLAVVMTGRPGIYLWFSFMVSTGVERVQKDVLTLGEEFMLII